ncbi:MAG: zf-TFIIB domain-containing protein [Anaeromyxobacteraceae bacterium]
MTDIRNPRTPSAEEEFFAREDAEKRRRLAAAVRQEEATSERERLRRLHHMQCPKCGLPMREVAFRGVTADTCSSCGGLFLDQDEIDRVVQPEERKGVVAGLLGMLR